MNTDHTDCSDTTHPRITTFIGPQLTRPPAPMTRNRLMQIASLGSASGHLDAQSTRLVCDAMIDAIVTSEVDGDRVAAAETRTRDADARAASTARISEARLATANDRMAKAERALAASELSARLLEQALLAARAQIRCLECQLEAKIDEFAMSVMTRGCQ